MVKNTLFIAEFIYPVLKCKSFGLCVKYNLFAQQAKQIKEVFFKLLFENVLLFIFAASTLSLADLLPSSGLDV